MTQTTDFLAAANSALCVYLDGDEYTENEVELVADLMHQAYSCRDKDHVYSTLLLEKAASYVQADMSELELATWVDLCIDSIYDAG